MARSDLQALAIFKMEDYEYSYSDNNRRMNYGFLKNFGAMNLDPNVSPKLSARNSYTGDSADDYNDVFGGPPKYISFMQSPKEHGEGRLLLAPSSGFSRLRLFDEIPVFGETRRKYVNDEFYNDIFNPDPVSSAGEASDKCSVTSRSTPRNLSPARTPLSRIAEHKAFGTGSPLLKLRQAGISSKQTEYPLFGTSPHHGPIKCLDVTNVSSAQSSPQSQSSPQAHSSDLLEIPFGSSSKAKKMLLGRKKYQDLGGLPPRTSNSRFQSFLETRESILQSPARLNYDKLYSTPQIPSCSNTLDDEWGNSIHRLHTRINRGVSKPVIKRPSSDTAKSVKSIEMADEGFENARLSSASDVPFTEHRRLVVSSPSRALHAQAKLKSWRDWVPESKGMHSNQESEYPSVGSSEISSAKEIHTDTGASSAQEVSQGVGSEPLVDSGEESDDLGSYVIEINAQKGETFAFLPEKDIEVDTGSPSNPLILSTKETEEWAKETPLNRRIAEALAHHAKGGKLERQSNDVDTLGNVEARIQTAKDIGKKKAFSKRSIDQQTAERSTSSNSVREVICSQITMEENIYSAASPTVTKEKLINEVRREALADPYSIDIPSMVQEVSQRIERWQCEKPVVFREILIPSERKNNLESHADGATARKTPEIRRKGLEMERQHQSGERLSKIVAEKKQKELEAEREQAEKIKSPETLDSEIKRWSAGKEGNIRALLSTMQYVLWQESGWKPVPLIEIIEGVAVKKAYQKARLCVHPDKLQQKGANFQQKYIAKRVFDILQEAWTIFNSLDPF